MKAKVKSGKELLFSEGASNDWSDLKGEIIINFEHRWSYRGFRQKKNHLYVNTVSGEIDIVFTGDVPVLMHGIYVKDQLILVWEDEKSKI